MPSLISELISSLEEQYTYYSELFDLSSTKKAAIIINDVKVIQDVNAKENTIIGKSQRAERKRITIVKDIASVLNVKESDLTVKTLAELIKDQPERSVLLETAARLRAKADALKEVNEQNKLLIQNSLDYIEFSMNLIRSSNDATPYTYTNKGIEIDNRKNFFDARQ